MNPETTEIILYRSDDGTIKIDVHMEDETVWLSLDQMAELCLAATKPPYPGTSKTFLKRASWAGIQLLQILQQLPQTEKPINSHLGHPASQGIHLEKAMDAYKKYRKRIAEEPTRAELDYLENLKQAQKKLQGKNGGGA